MVNNITQNKILKANTPKISVIIPVFNAATSIFDCLKAVYNTKYENFEVIVVDDNSTDGSTGIIQQFPCKLIRLIENNGPARARNIGAREADGDILMFVDSDAVLQNDAISQIITAFKENEEVACVSGIFSKDSISKGWLARYRDLQVHWWHRSSDSNASIFLVTGGAIKREVFNEINGFNEKYKNADIEDYEIGHRIAKKHKLYVDHSIQYKHYEYASSFLMLTKKLFTRAKMWIPLLLARKKFENNYATKSKGFSVVFALLSLVCLLMSFMNFYLFFLAIACFAAFIILDWRFYRFLFKEEGFFFLLFSIIIHYYYSVTLSCGGISGAINYIYQNDSN